MQRGQLPGWRDPDRQFRPRPDAGRLDDLGRRPDQLGPRADDVVGQRQELTHRGVAGRADGVVRTAEAALGAPDHPVREVPGVDQLQRSMRRPWCHDPPTPGQPDEPPGQPTDVLVRTEYQSRPGQQRPIGERS